jgi:methyl-accepting chemotaxis protein
LTWDTIAVLKNLNIGQRLAAGFLAVILLFLAVAAVSLYTAARLREADAMATHTSVVIARANDMLKAMLNMETGTRGFLLSGNEANLAPWNDGKQAFETSWSDLQKLTSTNPVQQDRLAMLRQHATEFEAVAEHLIERRRAVSAGSLDMPALTAEFSLGKDKAAMDAFREVEAAMVKTAADLLASRTEALDSLRTLNTAVTVGGTLAAVICAAVFAFWISRSITTPINIAVALAESVAGGDLTGRIDASGHDETARLLAALQAMAGKLSQIVGQVRTASDSIATGSSQIATGSADLSQRTEEQASNLQQTAASMEQINTTMRSNADTASEATQLAATASNSARQGGAVVAEVVSTMERITQSSRKVADIISVIDGIAFQTNILALNAAVEAARAGEQGRGFAVVASEVRGLAQRSANAAKEIKTLISESVETTETGARLVGDAGRTMDEIVAQVQRVSDLIQGMHAATQEQMAGVGQVSDAVTQLDQVTQQNAALVEESAAAAESLRSQAEQMVAAVGLFKLA